MHKINIREYIKYYIIFLYISIMSLRDGRALIALRGNTKYCMKKKQKYPQLHQQFNSTKMKLKC